ncbi:PREDICTED: CMRF35-like molecule 9 [Miniopterus natalensis]|uniref:CMRF35-like molecule 9 n=1 Tax=Miniopterus natalensis TaxID=291302 RepID=UPI0007A71D4E|nr:PREDICTED: CMRF35-like molecule 9 [Miniopterus natalensis]
MRPLVLLWGCLVLPGYGALVGPNKIRGFEGDTVSLQCTYDEKLKMNQKYWCRKSRTLISRCSDIIYAREDGQERREGRVSIQDSPQKLMLNVTLRELTLQDSGEYWCGINKLGFDQIFLVSLLVLPGPCCPSPTHSFQPLATSLQPKAKAWQTQPPELTSSGVHPTVTTAEQGKTEAKASPFTGTSPPKPARTSLYTRTSPYSGTSPHTVTSPNEETSPHKATSPHAGTSHPPTLLDSTSAEDTSPRSRSFKSRVSPSTVRMLAPVLVLLILLLAAGLAAVVGRCIAQWRKEAQLTIETQRGEKVHLSYLGIYEPQDQPFRLPPLLPRTGCVLTEPLFRPLGNGLVPESAVTKLAAPTGPHASPKPSASPYTESRCQSQVWTEGPGDREPPSLAPL